MSFALQLLGAIAVLTGALVWLDRSVSVNSRIGSARESARRDA